MAKEEKQKTRIWFKQNLMSLLVATTVSVIISLMGYTYSQDKKSNDAKFKANDAKFTEILKTINHEISERKADDSKELDARTNEDSKLRDLIDNRVSYREFLGLTGDVKETREDVKSILKKLKL